MVTAAILLPIAAAAFFGLLILGAAYLAAKSLWKYAKDFYQPTYTVIV